MTGSGRDRHDDDKFTAGQVVSILPRTFDFDFAAVRFDDTPANRQSQTQAPAAKGSFARAVLPHIPANMHPLEYPVVVSRVNADAGIAHAEAQRLPVMGSADENTAAVGRIFNGVTEQIVQRQV